MSHLTDFLLGLHGPMVYAVVGALIFLEASAFVGLVIPGETGLLVGAVLAAQGNISVSWLLLIACVAAVAGDSVGYEIGRHFGPALERSRPGRRVGEARWAKAHEFITKHGAWAVVLGRWVGVLRALVPCTTGMMGMHYPRFLLANAFGGITWATAVVAVGYAVGGSLTRAEAILGRTSLVIGGVLLTVVLVTLAVRRRRISDKHV